MKFYRLNVSINTLNQKLLFWQMESGYSSQITFVIERARNGADFEEIGTVTNDCVFIDPDKLNWNKDKNMRYIVKFQHNGEWVYSPATGVTGDWTVDDMKLAKEIRRKETLLICKHGNRGILLKRKEWGAQCPVCVDHDTKEVTNKQCVTCLGTGIVGGYYRPIVLNGSLSNLSTERKTGQIGVQQSAVRSIRVVTYPFIEPFDIWIDEFKNERYTIGRTIKNDVEIKGVPVVSTLELRLIPQTDVLYSEEANTLAYDDPVDKTEEQIENTNKWHKLDNLNW